MDGGMVMKKPDFMKKEEPILVAIHCLVYNHEPYLRDCFEGFVMQKTNFRFVAIVHDDCSTDNSADIIREYEAKYPDIFRPIYETENQWHKTDGSLERIMNVAIDATGAKYVAMCEGDDYWTDPLKLQKQVDFMENHPDVGLCYTNYNVYYEDNALLELAKFQNGMHRSQNFEDHLLTRGYIAPMTWMCRRDVYYKLIQHIGIHTDGSFALALEFYHFSNVAYIDEVTATYRVHENSASRQIDPEKKWQYDLGVMETQLEYAQKYGDEALVQKVCLNSYLINLLPLAITLNKQDFIQTAREYANSIGLIFDDYLALIKLSLKREKQYYLIQESHSYRLGKLLLKPFRWMKRKK